MNQTSASCQIRTRGEGSANPAAQNGSEQPVCSTPVPISHEDPLHLGQNCCQNPGGEITVPTISTNAATTFAQIDKLDAEGEKLPSLAVQSEGLQHCSSGRNLNACTDAPEGVVGSPQYLQDGAGLLAPPVQPPLIQGTASNQNLLVSGQLENRSEQVDDPQVFISEGGQSNVTSYIRYSEGLDPQRSISSCGIGMDDTHSREFQQNIFGSGTHNGHGDCYLDPVQGIIQNSGGLPANPNQVPVFPGNHHIPGQQMQGQHCHQVPALQALGAASSGRMEFHNIPVENTLEDNMNSREGDSVPHMEKTLNKDVAPEHGVAEGSYVDVQSLEQGGSSSGGTDLAGVRDSDLVVHLPSLLVDYLAMELDGDPDMGCVGWHRLAGLKGFTHSQVRRIANKRNISSQFKYLLNTCEAFSEYTYGQLKDDLYKLPRKDVLHQLVTGNWKLQ